jgi:hypothetical protein
MKQCGVLGEAWSFLKQTATPFMAGRAAASIAASSQWALFED